MTVIEAKTRAVNGSSDRPHSGGLIVHHAVPDDVVAKWRSVWRGGIDTPNTQPDRFLLIIRAMGAEPWIVESYSPDSAFGLVIARKQLVSGTVGAGYLKVRLPKLRSLIVVYGGILGQVEQWDELVCELKQALDAREVDSITFMRLPVDAPLASRLQRERRVVVSKAVPHWRLKLGASFETTMARHSSKHRKRLRWEVRRLRDALGDEMQFVTYETAADVETVLSSAEKVGRSTYHARIGGLVELTTVWKAQLAPAADAGALRAHFITVKGKAVAFVLGINEGPTLHVMAMAYLPEYATYSPGKHLLLHAIERACMDGLEWVDYGFGDAEYKRAYGTESREEATVTWYGPTARARAAWLLESFSTWCDPRIRRLLGHSSAARVKRTWRRLVTGSGGEMDR